MTLFMTLLTPGTGGPPYLRHYAGYGSIQWARAAVSKYRRCYRTLSMGGH